MRKYHINRRNEGDKFWKQNLIISSFWSSFLLKPYKQYATVGFLKVSYQIWAKGIEMWIAKITLGNKQQQENPTPVNLFISSSSSSLEVPDLNRCCFLSLSCQRMKRRRKRRMKKSCRCHCCCRCHLKRSWKSHCCLTMSHWRSRLNHCCCRWCL